MKLSHAFTINVMAGVIALAVLASGILCNEATGQTVQREPTPRPSSFVILDQDGYSTGDCLADASSICGRIIADSFCQSKGFKSAITFRRAEAGDVTGSVRSEQLPTRAPTPPAFIVTCR